MFFYKDSFLPYNGWEMTIELFEYVFLSAITLLSVLLGLYIAVKVGKKRVKRWIAGERLAIGNQLVKLLADMYEESGAGELIQQVSGGGEGLGGLASVAESFGIDLGPLKGIAGMLGGKKQEGGGSSGW